LQVGAKNAFRAHIEVVTVTKTKHNLLTRRFYFFGVSAKRTPPLITFAPFFSGHFFTTTITGHIFMIYKNAKVVFCVKKSKKY
jgi:hypothetical protein